MQPLKSQKEYFEMTSFDDKVKLSKDAGARLTPIQVEFLKDAIYEGYRHAMGRTPKAMSPRQRNVKKTFVDGLRSSMADLDSYLFLMSTIYQVPTWLKPKDLRNAVSADQAARFVTNLCSVLGREYSDRILLEVSGLYAGRGERVQIVRDPG